MFSHDAAHLPTVRTDVHLKKSGIFCGFGHPESKDNTIQYKFVRTPSIIVDLVFFFKVH